VLCRRIFYTDEFYFSAFKTLDFSPCLSLRIALILFRLTEETSKNDRFMTSQINLSFQAASKANSCVPKVIFRIRLGAPTFRVLLCKVHKVEENEND
jgi:hypothetical protein